VVTGFADIAFSEHRTRSASTPLPCVHDRIPCQSTAHVDVASHLTASTPLSRVYCRILCQSTGHLYHRSMGGLLLHCCRRVTHDCVRADRCVYCRIPCQSTDRLYHNCCESTDTFTLCTRHAGVFVDPRTLVHCFFQTNIAHYFTKFTQTC